MIFDVLQWLIFKPKYSFVLQCQKLIKPLFEIQLSNVSIG
jgi:hypothetical protein